MNNTGVYDIHTNVVQYPTRMQPTRARIEQVAPEDEETGRGSSTVFPPLSVRLAHNFSVVDTYYETSTAGVISAADDGTADFLAPFNGLGSVSDEMRDLLPLECRKAFDAARDGEASWRSNWGPESEKASRRQPIIDKSIVPYSMT